MFFYLSADNFIQICLAPFHFKTDRTMSQKTRQSQANYDAWSSYTSFVASQTKERDHLSYFYKHLLCTISIITATNEKGVIIPFYR